jgi:hypothetical protein
MAGGRATFASDGVRLHATSGGSPLHLAFVGAVDRAPVGRDVLPARANYLRGRDASTWIRGVRSFASVVYEGLYPGLDVRFHADRGPLEYDVLVAPGADVSRLALRIAGAGSVALDGAGRLVASGPSGDLVQEAPVAWQEGPSGREDVPVRFALRADGTVGLVLGTHDTTRAVVIDPTIAWANFLGGSGFESSFRDALAVAADGSMYVGGSTSSPDFPVVGGSGDLGGDDAFVAKFDASGNLVWCTYLGGSLAEAVHDLTLDSAGNLVLAGYTMSDDFPTTAGAHIGVKPGPTSVTTAVIVKLDPTGALLYSTYVGGSNYCSFLSVAIGPSDRVYAGGWARPGYPTTAGAYATTSIGGPTTPCLVLSVLDTGVSGAAALLYSTYVSGQTSSRANDIAVDAAGDVCMAVTTATSIADRKTDPPIVLFPTTANAYIRTLSIPRRSFFDASIFCKLRPAGAGTADLLYSTWICPKQSFGDDTDGVCVTSAGIAYVAGAVHEEAGYTASTNAYDRTFNGHRDAVLTAFNPSASGAASRTYATFIGGDGQDEFHDVALEPGTGRLLLVGSSGSPGTTKGPTGNQQYPTTPDAVQRIRAGGTEGGDLVMSIFDLTQTGSAQLAYSTLFGGTGGTAANGRGWEWGQAIAPVPGGGFAVYAIFESVTGYPTVSWPYDATSNGNQDMAVVRFGP